MTKKRKKRIRPALDERHYIAIELLTSVPTPNLADIAQACAVDRRTLYRWRKRSDFDRELRKVSRKKAEAMRRKARRTQTPMSIDGIERLFKCVGWL